VAIQPLPFNLAFLFFRMRILKAWAGCTTPPFIEFKQSIRLLTDRL